ncbi:MAG: PqqD family protein [Planctomycetota bacterium]
MNTKLKRANGVVWEEMGGQGLLVDSATGAQWRLNAAALAVWNWCDGTHSVHAMSSRLADLTGRCVTDCRYELRRFVELFSGAGLLECAGASGVGIAPQTVHFSAGSLLSASFLGKGLGGPRRRPSPRGNSGPG